jgi:multicomponent Na+:H+ antiporter subunit G
MSLALDIFTVVMVVTGLFFFYAGSIGMLRFPTVESRLHALTKADNLSVGFIALGVMPQMAEATDALKLLLAWALILFSSAAASQLIAIAARRNRRRDP